jgi:hypothetical protein
MPEGALPPQLSFCFFKALKYKVAACEKDLQGSTAGGSKSRQ